MENSPPITKDQRNAIFGLLNNLKLLDVRTEIVLGHTQGRTSSIAKLTKQEARGIIDFLVTAQNRHKPDTVAKQRRKLLVQFHELGWHQYNAETGEVQTLPDGRRKLDYDRIDNWLKKHTPAHKTLNQMDGMELAQAITIAKKMANQKNIN